MSARNAPTLFWILLLALCLRLLWVGAPLIGAHSWRQTATASMARNFHAQGDGILYPSIDWRGDGPGFVESEFPVYPFLVAKLYDGFGVHEGLGRAVSALFSVVGIWALYSLVLGLIDRRTALWTALLVTILPLSIYYGRSFQPEATLLMTSTLGLLAASRWARTGEWTALVAAGAAIGVAVAVKLSILFLGLPLLYLFWLRFGWRLFRQPHFYVFGAIALLPAMAWYDHAQLLHAETGLTFGIWSEAGADKWGNWDLVSSAVYWKRIVIRYLLKRHLVYVGFALFGIGLFLTRRSREERFFDVWLLSGLAFLVVVGRGNWEHEYYQLPVVLPMLVFAAKVLARHLHWPTRGDRRAQALLVAVFALVGLSAERRMAYAAREDPEGSAQLELAARIQSLVPAGGLVVSATEGDPTVLYLAARKGWIVGADRVAAKPLEELRARGARAVFGSHQQFRARNAANLDWILGESGYGVLHDDGETFLVALPPHESGRK